MPPNLGGVPGFPFVMPRELAITPTSIPPIRALPQIISLA
jgi:hypothetical protein